jgi:ribosome maturation factor RimP
MAGLWEDLVGKNVKVVFIDNAKEQREKVYRGKLIGVDATFLKLEMDGRKSMLPLNVIRKVNEVIPGREVE